MMPNMASGTSPFPIQPKSRARASKQTAVEKENTQNRTSKLDTSVNDIDKAMTEMSMTKQKPICVKRHEIQSIDLPTYPFCKINTTCTHKPLADCAKSLSIEAKLSSSLLNTIQSLSLKSSASLALEDNLTTIKQTIKQCLKAPNLQSLRVAIHSLRATYELIDKVTGVKLAFHACVLAGERMLKCLDDVNSSQAKSNKLGDVERWTEVGEYAILSLAAYHSLGRIIKGKFTWEMLLYPKKELLPKRQMLKICIESGIIASTAFMHLSLLSMKRVAIEDEFKFDFSAASFQPILAKAVFPLLLNEELEVEDGSKYAKRMFRCVWDAARCIEGCDILIIHLRCVAVTLLTQFCVEMFPHYNSEGRKELHSLWDKASSSALKTVILADKKSNIEEISTALIEFHNIAGGMMDNAWIQIYTNHKLAPSSYFEYCVYRSVHRWKYLDSMGSIHTPDVLLRIKDVKYRTQDMDSLVAMASLSMVLLALNARLILAGKEGVQLTDCNAVISNFDSVMFNSSIANQSRCRATVTLLNLQRDATKIISAQRSTPKANDGHALSILGYILGCCIAPLETSLAASTDDAQRAFSYHMSASDNHAKAALFLDAASEDSNVENKTRDKWNTECIRQIRKGFELLSPIVDSTNEFIRGSPTVSAVEMFAKTATSIGKKLSDENAASSMKCQLYASELLTRLAMKGSSNTSFHKYQIPNRYLLLASTFEAGGLTNETCAALALAAWSATKKNIYIVPSDDDVFIGDTVSEEILLFPRTALPNICPQSPTYLDGLAVIINKLTRACIESLETNSSSKTILPSNSTLWKLLQSSNRETKGMQISILFDFIIWDNRTYTITQILELIRELLKCATKVLKSYTLNKPHDRQNKLVSAVSKELDKFLCLQISRLRSLISNEDLQVISSALHVIFAMCMTDAPFISFPKQHLHLHLKKDRRSDVQCTMVEFSLHNMQSAVEVFAKASNENDIIQDVCFFVQWSAISVHHAILFEHYSIIAPCDEIEVAPMQQYVKVLDICNLAIHHLVHTDNDTPCQVIESLILTLRRLLCRFSLHGDALLSSQCFVQLQKLYSLDEECQHVLDSVSDFLWMSSKFDNLTTVLVDSCNFGSTERIKNLLCEEVQYSNQDEQTDLLSSCLVDFIVNTFQIVSEGQIISETNDNDQSLKDISEFIQAFQTAIEGVETGDETDLDAIYDRSELIVQIQSLVITALMLQSKMHLNARRPELSIRYLNACQSECKRMITMLRLLSTHIQYPDDKFIQVDDLLHMGLERISVAFSSLGLRRKAEDSALLAVVKQKAIAFETFSLHKISFQEMIKSIQRLDGFYNYLPAIRTLITIKSMSLSPDKFSVESTLFDKFNFSDSKPCLSVNDTINRSQTFLTYDDCFRYTPELKSQCDTFLSLAHDSITSLIDQSETKSSEGVPLNSFLYATQQEVKLRMFRDASDESIAIEQEEKIVANHYGSRSCLADAYFELGLKALNNAKSSNEIYHLWMDHAVKADVAEDVGTESSNYITLARKHFNCALHYANPASSYLTKKILRCLALASGPGTLASFLIHASVGGTSRNMVRDAIKPGSKLHKIFNMCDDEISSVESRSEEFNTILADYATLIPSNWTISALAVCPTGDILITSFRVPDDKESTIKTICIFNTNTTVNDGSKQSTIHNDIILPLDTIIERSQRQLRGIDEEMQCEKYNDEASRRKWWDERHSIDSDLCCLLKRAENEYFGYDQVKQVLISTSSDPSQLDDDNSECSDIGPGNLVSRFEAAERESLRGFDEDAERLVLKKLTVVNLRERLHSFGVRGTTVQKMRKADLIDLVVAEMEKDFRQIDLSAPIHMKQNEPLVSDTNVDQRQDEKERTEQCIVLILDENLHRLPLESMEMFANKAVTRMPSLPFVIAALHERHIASSDSTPVVDPNKLKFILDPEQNLSETSSIMTAALKSMSSTNGWDWEGCVGKIPTPEFMSTVLTQNEGFLLYCGHGGGEKFYSRSQVEDFISNSENKPDPHRGCRSVIVLMGCSSGKLKSVNHSNNASWGSTYPVHYEPEGISLSYIFAGAPCVVGNLWDVTDRDIDRYCLTLLNDFFDHKKEASSSPSLAKCVALARRACKLRYIVGSAPVCYGIPVQCKKV